MKKSLGAKTLLYPTPAWVIATYDADGKPNIMTAAWAGVCCSKPPSVTVSLRKATYSYASILARKAYTVNVFSERHLAEVDYFGIASGRDTDKFAETGFTAVPSDVVDAPYVAEAPLVIEGNLLKSIEIGLHTLFVAEIKDVKAEEDVLGDDGLPDIEKLAPFAYAPTKGCYYGLGKMLGKAYSVGMKFKR